MNYTKHETVLKKECVDYLTEGAPFDQKVLFADLTFGGGGHSKALLDSDISCHVLAFDQDPDAVRNGREIIKDLDDPSRIELVHGNFREFPKFYEERISSSGVKLKGILMDLGVSGHHFDKAERGFSFRLDGPLDMRMNANDDNVPLAKEILNEYPKEDLEKIFREYGEERFSSRIADSIVSTRGSKPFLRTKDLEEVIFHCYPKKLRFKGAHPATRCFQALRIFINRELDVLRETLPKLMPLLSSGGRIAIISFHSLEDRIVKLGFKELAKGDIPCKILTKKPLLPSEEEIKNNLRSRSAKLRVIEKI